MGNSAEIFFVVSSISRAPWWHWWRECGSSKVPFPDDRKSRRRAAVTGRYRAVVLLEGVRLCSVFCQTPPHARGRRKQYLPSFFV